MYYKPISTNVIMLKTLFVCLNSRSDGAIFKMSFETPTEDYITKTLIEIFLNCYTLERDAEKTG